MRFPCSVLVTPEVSQCTLAIVKLFFTRRTPDASTKQRILDTSALVAGVVANHLSPKAYGPSGTFPVLPPGLTVSAEDDVSLFTYYTVMLGLASILLVDGQHSEIHSGSRTN